MTARRETNSVVVKKSVAWLGPKWRINRWRRLVRGFAGAEALGAPAVGGHGQEEYENLAIKEGKNAVKWTKLSCRRFKDNAALLQLFALAYNLANFLRQLVLPKPIRGWTLTTGFSAPCAAIRNAGPLKKPWRDCRGRPPKAEFPVEFPTKNERGARSLAARGQTGRHTERGNRNGQASLAAFPPTGPGSEETRSRNHRG
jgi:hypothetical protein